MDKIQLGDSQLYTFNTGFDIPIQEEEPIHINYVQVNPTTFDTGFEQIKIDIQPVQDKQFIESDSIITTLNTGFDKHDDKPVIQEVEYKCDIQQNPSSVIENIETGFGCDNQLVVECPKPEYKTHLCKENYLSEFKTEAEKVLARNNLGVYSKKEIDIIIGGIIENHSQYVTKNEVESMVSNLNFVNSTLKAYANYLIPDNLFNL